VAFGYVARPIMIVDRTSGALVSRPVSAIGTVDAALEIGLWRRLAIGLGMPATLYARGDRLAGLGVGDDRPLASPKLGDVRFRAKVALAETRSVRIAVAGIFTLPASGENDFAATAGPTFEPRLIADVTTSHVLFAAQVGVRFMPDRVLFGTHFGDELSFAIGATSGWRWFRIVTELAGAVGEEVHPIEARGALRFLLPHALSVDAGAGGGLDRDPTAAQWRAFLILRHAQ
jgi:hypothetical protein